jgi:hypothetical protein
MAMYSINMLHFIELANIKGLRRIGLHSFRHSSISEAMHHIAERYLLWDDQDAFYYDAVQFENGTSQRLGSAPW